LLLGWSPGVFLLPQKTNTVCKTVGRYPNPKKISVNVNKFFETTKSNLVCEISHVCPGLWRTTACHCLHRGFPTGPECKVRHKHCKRNSYTYAHTEAVAVEAVVVVEGLGVVAVVVVVDDPAAASMSSYVEK